MKGYRFMAKKGRKKKVVRKTADIDYSKKKDYMRQRSAEMSVSGREIGEIPEVADPARRETASKDFIFFCETYFPEAFPLEWSDDHVRIIKKIETAVIGGACFAEAMPRGSGKTTIAEKSVIWSIVFGYHSFMALIGSSETAAQEMIDSVKQEFEDNELLSDDFPEVCYPIHCIDGIANRAPGQLYHGERTRITWTGKEMVLPRIEGSKASGAIVKIAGITGRVRGMKHRMPDGSVARPSLVIIDDPQTAESAYSLSQCATRERILAGDILGMAGPGKKITAIMPCTVIRSGDMADSILDRTKHPEWNGERTKMVYEFPKNEKIWDKYSEIWAECQRMHGNIDEATEFYRKNQKAMDEGAKIAWVQRYNHDEASAIQHAMNLKIKDAWSFFAEYQNEPLSVELENETKIMSSDEISEKINRYKHKEIPMNVNKLTAFIDIQEKMLFYCVCAFEDNFNGYLIDYGAFPKQNRSFYTLRDARTTLAHKYKNTGLEGRIYAGLTELTEILLGVEWQREDGTMMRIDRCLIDAAWGRSTETVYQFCRQSKYSNMVMPSHGVGITAGRTPMSEYKKQRGDQLGNNWRVPAAGKNNRTIRHVNYDTNWWKSFFHTRLAVAMGDKGCFSLFGAKPVIHKMYAEQLVAEYSVRTEGKGRVVDEWKIKPNRPDNHWLDCTVGCCVAASMLGVKLEGAEGITSTIRARRKFKVPGQTTVRRIK